MASLKWTYRADPRGIMVMKDGKDYHVFPEVELAREFCAIFNGEVVITWGQDRCNASATAHAYVGREMAPVAPLCKRGWNRGEGFSILRNIVTGPHCKVCLQKAMNGNLEPYLL